VHLSPHEQERLMIHVAADVAARRRARGVRLNYPEVVALLTAHVLEGARDGKTVRELMSSGRGVLTRPEVMPGVAEMVKTVQVEATFPDGTKMVTISDPIPARTDVPAPGQVRHPDNAEPIPVGPTAGPVKRVQVENKGDRPIQVGSHFHFYEVNEDLEIKEAPATGTTEIDRECAWGMRLYIPAGKSRRFEPKCTVEVDLVPIEGDRKIRGLRGLVAEKNEADCVEGAEDLVKLDRAAL
jgi:urease subunit gamma/beta